MSNISIEFENISKQYRLGTIGTGTLTHDLNRWWHLMRGKEDPYLKVGEVNDRSIKATSDYVWALKDISFSVEQGEVLGIIGKNGAGKSTLLKILSRVTSPTTGSIRAKGRIASLLEVGTGFHTELTGRENIYMNGAILGMTRKEITRKFDEIVDFSGIEKYIDTPVKRYSSGMTVRLGFAVAAHLEPEILVVDEVLAVGDAEFQRKAIGKMKDVSQGGGRTVLFVSHNMTAVESLCNKGIVLENGGVTFTGTSAEAVTYYLENEQKNNATSFKWDESNAPGVGPVRVLEYKIEKSSSPLLIITEPLRLLCTFKVDNDQKDINLSLHALNSRGEVLFVQPTTWLDLKQGVHTVEFIIPEDILNSQMYYFQLLFVKNSRELFWLEEKLVAEMKEDERNTAWMGTWSGYVRPKINWNLV